jgi:uncharacterized short protein YbdD (DUF466 family)
MLGKRTGGQADGWTEKADRIAAALRRIAGMPDYAAYVDHLRRSHPECPIPNQREFYDQYVRNRYADGPTRCC